MTAVYAMIREAILNKRIVLATYHGHRRTMCPHALGKKRGREQALFYQFAGTSSTGLGPVGSPDNWRCIPLAGLTNVSVTDGDWHTGRNHSRPQTCIDIIDVQVTY